MADMVCGNESQGECNEDSGVSFVLYGPYSPGDGGNIYDGRGLYGDMTTECVKGLLALLEEGRCPVDFVRQSAREVGIVTD